MSLPSSIPLRREPEGSGSSFGAADAWVSALVVLAVLAMVVWAWWRRRMAGPADGETSQRRPMALGRLLGLPPGKGPAVIASTRLTPTHSLHEVRWDGRRLLIGCSPQAVSVLSEGANTPPDPERSSNPASGESGQ